MQVKQNTTDRQINPHRPGQVKRNSALQMHKLALNTKKQYLQGCGPHPQRNKKPKHTCSLFQRKREQNSDSTTFTAQAS